MIYNPILQENYPFGVVFLSVYYLILKEIVCGLASYWKNWNRKNERKEKNKVHSIGDTAARVFDVLENDFGGFILRKSMRNVKYIVGILCAVMMVLISSSVFAAGPGKGQINGELRAGMTQFVVNYDISQFMGEPTVNGNYMWNGNSSVSELDYRTVVWLHVTNGVSDAWIKLDPTVPSKGEWSYNVTGSPNWDHALVEAWQQETITSYIPADRAKYFWKNGFWVKAAVTSRSPI